MQEHLTSQLGQVRSTMVEMALTMGALVKSFDEIAGQLVSSPRLKTRGDVELELYCRSRKCQAGPFKYYSSRASHEIRQHGRIFRRKKLGAGQRR